MSIPVECDWRLRILVDRLSFYNIKQSFIDAGYLLLTIDYTSSKEKLKYKCPLGHINSVLWANWKKGSRCPTCFNIKRRNNVDNIREDFASKGYTLLSTEYKNNKTKLYYVCPNDHKHSIRWNDWQQGCRCPDCAKNASLSFESIRISFEKEGYTLISEEYINSTSKLHYMCAAGHKHTISWNAWQRGRSCPTCSIINRSGPNHYDWKNGASLLPYCVNWTKELKEFIKSRDNYTCQNPYCWKKDTVLSIHHIDYNKENCSIYNLITLCRSCNSRANHNRQLHYDLYKNILKSNYGDVE